VIVNSGRLEKALTYLASTDREEADLFADAERKKKAMESMFTTIAAHSEGTVIQREAKAYEHSRYEEARDAYLAALSEHRAMKNKRSTESILIEVWRSLNAARNKGQIV
jgi:hypothetical protein